MCLAVLQQKESTGLETMVNYVIFNSKLVLSSRPQVNVGYHL